MSKKATAKSIKNLSVSGLLLPAFLGGVLLLILIVVGIIKLVGVSGDNYIKWRINHDYQKVAIPKNLIFEEQRWLPSPDPLLPLPGNGEWEYDYNDQNYPTSDESKNAAFYYSAFQTSFKQDGYLISDTNPNGYYATKKGMTAYVHFQYIEEVGSPGKYLQIVVTANGESIND